MGNDVDGVVLDVDGTVLRGEAVIDGADEGLRLLRDAGIPVVFLSNNPTVTSDGLRRRLVGSGVRVDGAAGYLTSASLTARYVREECSGAVAYVLGEDGVVDALRTEGITVVEDGDGEIDVAVVSIDRGLRYDDIREAADVARAAPGYVCTDPDAVIPTGDGDVPGTGAVEAAVSTAAGREPTVVGKPSGFAAEAALDILGTPPERTLFVGDRLDTDVALSEGVGAPTAAVLTGVTSEGDVEEAVDRNRPDHVLDSLAGVGGLL